MGGSAWTNYRFVRLPAVLAGVDEVLFHRIDKRQNDKGETAYYLSTRRYAPVKGKPGAAAAKLARLSAATATTEVQRVLGVARWKRETELYVVVRNLFPEHSVEREARLPWLGGLRLDVFVPELQLAFEHMGEQHYRPIAIFGGEAAHRRTVERDILKRDLCQKHGVTVIDVKPDEAITSASLRRRVPVSIRGKTT